MLAVGVDMASVLLHLQLFSRVELTQHGVGIQCVLTPSPQHCGQTLVVPVIVISLVIQLETEKYCVQEER